MIISGINIGGGSGPLVGWTMWDVPPPILGNKAIFGYGKATSTQSSITNLVSNTGTVSTDTTGVGTAREGIAATKYGGDKAIFGHGYTGSALTAVTNLVSNTGTVATDTTGVGNAKYYAAAATYGSTGQAMFGFGSIGLGYSQAKNYINKISNTGVVSTDSSFVGFERMGLAATGYGTDKAIFGWGYGYNGTYQKKVNLVSNTGVVAADTTLSASYQTKGYLAAAGYGSTGQAIFGYGGQYNNNEINLVSNTGTIATASQYIGTSRGYVAAATYGSDKSIFGYGLSYAGDSLSMTNKVSNTGVVSVDTTGVGTARMGLGAASYSA
jgi:hypothetical protein